MQQEGFDEPLSGLVGGFFVNFKRSKFVVVVILEGDCRWIEVINNYNKFTY